MPKNVLVVGMARSGTSLASSIFARQGYYVGPISRPSYRDGNDHNPFGYFEADAVAEANVEVFQQAGYPCHNTWLFEPIPPEPVDRIVELEPLESHRRLIAAYDRNAPWLCKNVRLCYTLPYWWKLMDPSRTGVLLLRRDPKEIYRSFMSWGWHPPGNGDLRERIHQRIEQHLAAAVRAVESLAIPHVGVDYAEYRQSPGAVAHRLSEFFELELTPEDLNYRPELNHSTLRGRIASFLRMQAMRLPRRPVRAVERLVPRPLLAMVFPECKQSRRQLFAAGSLSQ